MIQNVVDDGSYFEKATPQAQKGNYTSLYPGVDI